MNQAITRWLSTYFGRWRPVRPASRVEHAAVLRTEARSTRDDERRSEPPGILHSVLAPGGFCRPGRRALPPSLVLYTVSEGQYLPKSTTGCDPCALITRFFSC